MSEKSKTRPHLSYLLGGLITVVPLLVTVFLFQLVFQVLSDIGGPVVRWIGARVAESVPGLENVITTAWIENTLAVLVVLVGLYALGFATSLVLGRRIVTFFESLLRRVPVIETVYGSVRRLLEVLQQSPTDAQRVVLIRFPTPEMKTVGLVTRTFSDARTGSKLAAVYVPTTPNPTSGYLEIVPLEDLTPTDWTIDDAMSFIISGGAVSPDTINYHDAAPAEPARSEP